MSGTTPGADALMLLDADDVAVAIIAMDAGQTVTVRGPSGDHTIEVREAVPQYHKVAVHPVAAGKPVHRNGTIIGEATRDIAVGHCVHTHNLRSLRARAGR